MVTPCVQYCLLLAVATECCASLATASEPDPFPLVCGLARFSADDGGRLHLQLEVANRGEVPIYVYKRAPIVSVIYSEVKGGNVNRDYLPEQVVEVRGLPADIVVTNLSLLNRRQSIEMELTIDAMPGFEVTGIEVDLVYGDHREDFRIENRKSLKFRRHVRIWDNERSHPSVD